MVSANHSLTILCKLCTRLKTYAPQTRRCVWSADLGGKSRSQAMLLTSGLARISHGWVSGMVARSVSNARDGTTIVSCVGFRV